MSIVSRRFLPLFIVVFLIGAVFRFSLYNKNRPSIRTMIPSKIVVESAIQCPLPTEAFCVREVLEALELPLSRPDYSLQSLKHPLDLTRLSSSCQAFLIPRHVSDKRRKELECFFPKPWLQRFKFFDKERIRSVLLLIRDYFHRAHIPIAMSYGSALGSWRMHGQIPYDHDIDFFVLRRHMSRATDLMKKMEKSNHHLFHTYYFSKNLWRFDVKHQDGSDLILFDVFFHKLRSDDSVIEQYAIPPTIKAQNLLPLVKRPFEGVLFKTWRNVKQYFQQVYGKEGEITCKPTPWMVEAYKMKCGASVVNCSELNFFFNFARRWEQKDGKLVEVLFNRSHALSVFYSPEGV